MQDTTVNLCRFIHEKGYMLRKSEFTNWGITQNEQRRKYDVLGVLLAMNLCHRGNGWLTFSCTIGKFFGWDKEDADEEKFVADLWKIPEYLFDKYPSWDE